MAIFSTIILSPLGAWSTRMISLRSSLSWTSTTRTRPERESAFFLLCSLSLSLFRFSFLLLCTPSMDVLCLKKSCLFPELVPGCQAAKVKLSWGNIWGWRLWTDEVCAQGRLLEVAELTELPLAVPTWWCQYARDFALLHFNFVQRSCLLSRHVIVLLFSKPINYRVCQLTCLMQELIG